MSCLAVKTSKNLYHATRMKTLADHLNCKHSGASVRLVARPLGSALRYFTTKHQLSSARSGGHCGRNIG
ncbi:hypothetical protein E4U53_004449, partial [Claviceps sorghi]